MADSIEVSKYPEDCCNEQAFRSANDVGDHGKEVCTKHFFNWKHTSFIEDLNSSK